MFNEEELIFIKTLLEDELFKINTKKHKIEDKSARDIFKTFVQPRCDFMVRLIEKIENLEVKEEL